jgi:N-methylhydantoinase A
VALRLGIDTGGTFTDFVLLDELTGELRVAKVSSTPDDPARAIENGLAAMGVDGLIGHTVVGTTIATNAVLENVGPPLVFITNAGFEDVPFIGRLDKEHLYDLHWRKPRPLVLRQCCIGVPGRIDYRGNVVEEISPEALEQLARRLLPFKADSPAVAVSLLFSYLRPDHERLIRDVVNDVMPEAAVSLSHEISPMWREYERANTTLVDAFVKPSIDDYVESVGAMLHRMTGSERWNLLGSNGGYMSAEEGRRRPAQLLVSGLAGGVIGGRFFVETTGFTSAFTLDMGGTSCDLGLVRDGAQQYASEFELAWGLPVTIPCVSVKTIGAGGGSIAAVDKGGLLHVGPRSSGAQPGPAAYGLGGTEPTVTDANLVLGRLDPEYFLGGSIQLDRDAALAALTGLGDRLGMSAHEAALATVRTSDENMANAIRLIAVDHGLDTRDFSLVAFGGAGPLHARSVAARLGMKTVVVPPGPGLCSAFGCAITEARVDRVQTHYLRSTAPDVVALAQTDTRLIDDASQALSRSTGHAPTEIRRSADLRYAGQNYELEIPMPDGPVDQSAWRTLLARFEREHLAQYGFMLGGEPIELINVRVTAARPAVRPRLESQTANRSSTRTDQRPVWFEATGPTMTDVLRRATLDVGAALTGPVIIEESDSTTVIFAGDMVHVAAHGELVISVGERT